ncbi:MAG: hypothetical protein GY856_04310 [bacterium]|nr:hypothetical protein [bacterium]
MRRKPSRRIDNRLRGSLWLDSVELAESSHDRVDHEPAGDHGSRLP